VPELRRLGHARAAGFLLDLLVVPEGPAPPAPGLSAVRAGAAGHLRRAVPLLRSLVLLDDWRWWQNPGPRAYTQLFLVLPMIPGRLPWGQSPKRRKRPRSVLARLAAERRAIVDDDPDLLAAPIRGQLALFPPLPRSMRFAHAARTADRRIAQEPVLLPLIAQHAGKRSETWRQQMRHVLRLAALAGIADGNERVNPKRLFDLPNYRKPAARILQAARMLDGPALSAYGL